MKALYLVAAVTMAGVSSVFVLLAELQQRYDLPTAGLGWIAGVAFAAALATQLSLSRYADRGHAGLLLRLGMGAVAIGLLWFGFSTELWQFVAARGVLGVGVGMILPPARRVIIAEAGDNQGQQLGTFYAAYLSGFVIGPPLAGLLTVAADVRFPFLVFGAVAAILAWVLRSMDVPEASAEAAAASAANPRVLRRLLRRRQVLAALLVMVSFRYSIGVFEPLWAVHLDGMGVSTLGITFSLMGFALPMLVVARPAGALSDRFGPRVTSLISAAVTVPLMAGYGYVTSFAVIMIMAVPHGLMEAVQSPGTQAALAEASPSEDSASAQGLGEAAGSAAAGIGAFTAAPLFAALGPAPAWLIAGVVMTVLLSASFLLDPPKLRVRRTPVAAARP